MNDSTETTVNEEDQMEDDSKLTYLYQAIADTQATIRAVDVKIQILLGVLIAPLAVFDKIVSAINLCSFQDNKISFALSWAFVVFWVYGGLAAFAGMNSIGNPHDRILDKSSYKGTFFNGGQYKFRIWSALINRGIVSKNPVAKYISELPSDFKSHQRELAYEMMKITFIRDIKMRRQQEAMASTVIALILFGISKVAEV